MGADRVTIFYGIRFQVSDKEEISLLSRGKHPLVKAARKYGLQLTGETSGSIAVSTTFFTLGRSSASSAEKRSPTRSCQMILLPRYSGTQERRSPPLAFRWFQL